MTMSQTTLLIGGSNGTATLCGILGDKSNPANRGHVLRVATRSADKYLQNPDQKSDQHPYKISGNDIDRHAKPRVWRCQEKKHLSDVFSADILPTRIVTHVGAPDSVFVYGSNSASDKNDENLLSPLEVAISGVGAPDNGGIVDLIVLCCPVSAHFSLLKHIARALYNLDRQALLGSSPARPPILIGTLYSAGGFDWMSRIAFAMERPPNFTSWTRALGLFGLKAFPYLCKSLTPGEVTLHGRFPQLQVALCPSNASMRSHARTLLDRLLQNETTGKKLEFLGLMSAEDLGGDGTCTDEQQFFTSLHNFNPRHAADVASTTGAVMLAASATNKKGDYSLSPTLLPPSNPPDQSSVSTPNNLPLLDMLVTSSISDRADPFATLSFLACTLNSTNQILHPCILVALFTDNGNNCPNTPYDELRPKKHALTNHHDDGIIKWNPKLRGTPLPRFYADGASHPLAGKLITSIAGGEMYFVIDALERLLSPRGYNPITALHGGEPVGRKVMNLLGNRPSDLGARSGLTNVAIKQEWERLNGKNVDSGAADVIQQRRMSGGSPNSNSLIHQERLLASLMSYGLSHNARLSAVLSPCIVIPPDSTPDISNIQLEPDEILLKPDVNTRFFTDDVQHGLCIYLGLAELLGFDLERDMPITLYVVRKLQRWMKKEFVLNSQSTSAKKIVAHAKDLGQTSAPQAFGVNCLGQLKQFLKLDLFGEETLSMAEHNLLSSSLVSKL